MSASSNEDRAARARAAALASLKSITPEEDVAITAAAEADPDNPPLTEEVFARMRPSTEAAPEFVEAMKRRRGERGPGKAPKKELVSLRLSADVLAHFRAEGDDWRARIDETLKRAING